MALRPTDNAEDRKRKLAERDAAQKDVFLREVDEAVRKDRMSDAGKRYGIPAAVLLVLGLAGFGGYLWWQGEQRAEAEAEAVTLTRALDRVDAGQDAGAVTELDPLLTSEVVGYRVAAQLAQAGLAIDAGDDAKAVRLFEAVAADDEAPRPFRDFATIRAVAAQYDEIAPARVVERLKPIATPGAPMFAPAAELLAMAYVETGKPELAGPLFAEIARDEEAPETLRARARQMAGLLGTDSIDDAEDVLEAIRRGTQAGQQADPRRTQ